MPYKKERSFRFALFLAVALAALFSASADPHVNISLVETVYENITFAENFTLTEQIKSCITVGTLNVTNPGVETVYDIYLEFINTNLLVTNFTWEPTTKFGNQTAGTNGTRMVLHIPELRYGNFTTFMYNVSCTTAPPPVNLDTNYSNFDHGFNNKVLAGYNWTLTQSATNNNTVGLTINNVNITMTAQKVQWNSSFFPFALGELYPHGDFANVGGNGTSNESWWWAPNGGSIPAGNSVYINYTMTAPFSVPFTATYQALQESITYEVNLLLSNLTLDRVNASADINFSFEKRIIQPSDNANNHNVTWEIAPFVNTPVNITYDLRKVTLWVTNTSNPNDKFTLFGYLNKTYNGTPLQRVNLTSSWDPSTDYWRFNYTDGSSGTAPPPIVWIKPDWLIANAEGQILNYTTTRSGSDIYMKYIYVINGYWLEVKKNVTNFGEGQYHINITVENIGNGWTPEYEVVTVYDFVPSNFQAWNMMPSPYDCPVGGNCANQSVTGTEFTGMSYQWQVAYKADMNSSLGPKNGQNATGLDNYTWSVAYDVNGSGAFRVSQLYIVGLDPLKVDGANASPIITIISGIQSYTNEIIYIAIVGFLIVVNVMNLVITHRINRKLQGTGQQHSYVQQPSQRPAAPAPKMPPPPRHLR